MATSSGTLLIYTSQDVPSIQDLLRDLALSVLTFNRMEDLLSEAEKVRPIGICVVAQGEEVRKIRDHFRQLEIRSLLENLRPILLIPINKVTAYDTCFLSVDAPWLQNLELTGFRDIIQIPARPSAKEFELLNQRLSFALNLTTKSPFSSQFQAMSKESSDVEIAVPSRLSWIAEGNLLGIESGGSFQIGNPVSIRIQPPQKEPLLLYGKVVENQPGELRYNYGNSIQVRLSAASTEKLQLQLQSKANSGMMRTPVRRAFVVTRSSGLRRRLVQTLSRNYVESRVPLVKRNVLTDLPFLSPHFIIFDERTLTDILEKDGSNFLQEMRSVAGENAQVIIIGLMNAAVRNLFPNARALLHDDSLDSEFKKILEGSTAPMSQQSASGRLWFPHDSPLASVLLNVKEKLAYISEDGLVIRSVNRYRLWRNTEITFSQKSYRFLAKGTRSYLVGDAFRMSQTPTASVSETPTLTFFSTLMNYTELAELLRESLSQHLSPLTPLDTLLTVAQAKPYGENVQVVEKEVKKIGNEKDAVAAATAAALASPGLPKGTSAAEAFSYIPTVARKPQPTKVHATHIWVALLILALVSLLILLTMRSGPAKEGGPYTDSFRKLFESQQN